MLIINFHLPSNQPVSKLNDGCIWGGGDNASSPSFGRATKSNVGENYISHPFTKLQNPQTYQILISNFHLWSNQPEFVRRNCNAIAFQSSSSSILGVPTFILHSSWYARSFRGWLRLWNCFAPAGKNPPEQKSGIPAGINILATSKMVEICKSSSNHCLIPFGLTCGQHHAWQW